MINALIQNFLKIFTWWIVVAPWEQALRVRAGKHVKKVDAGIYLKIPFLDRIFKQSTRRRLSMIRPQTLTTRDGHTITLSGALGYNIVDIEKLFQTLHHPEDTLEAEVASLVAEYIVLNNLDKCIPDIIENYVRGKMNLEQYGLGSQQFFLSSFTRVKTYRLITGEIPSWTRGNNLDTSTSEGESHGPGYNY
jgi:hypothetical protein